MAAASNSEGLSSPEDHAAAEVMPREEQPWLDYAVEQALLFKDKVDATTRSAARATTDRLSEIGSTAYVHSLYTTELVAGLAREYEELAFAKMKEGLLVAAEHPTITCSAVAGLGIVGLKRPRRFLFRYSRRLFPTEESLLSSAETKTKALRESVAQMKHEGKKIEEKGTLAEQDFLLGRTRLRQAGQQIQGLIQSAYRVEKEARGLKDILRDLPKKDASVFRAKVSLLTSEIKKEKNVLNKQISKITDYGISI